MLGLEPGQPQAVDMVMRHRLIAQLRHSQSGVRTRLLGSLCEPRTCWHEQFAHATHAPHPSSRGMCKLRRDGPRPMHVQQRGHYAAVRGLSPLDSMRSWPWT